MKREQKQVVVSELKEMFEKAQAAFLVNYQGLTVAQVQSLRKQLRKDDATFKVAKARLMKIATKDVGGSEQFSGNFKEKIGLVFAFKEVPSVAKDLVTFSKDNKSLRVISGFFDKQVISTAQVSNLASLPSKEILLAHLAGTLKAPVGSFHRVLHLLLAKLLYALKELEKQKGT